jgi:hypothetical protein
MTTGPIVFDELQREALAELVKQNRAGELRILRTIEQELYAATLRGFEAGVRMAADEMGRQRLAAEINSLDHFVPDQAGYQAN